ncbi:hypothetical protein LI328DRAFT_2650 [Trichoderma asperelloides]|nr:hypothetical protein LI328DRAFT_2650 [Trichoderma asperelloides]
MRIQKISEVRKGIFFSVFSRDGTAMHMNFHHLSGIPVRCIAGSHQGAYLADVMFSNISFLFPLLVFSLSLLFFCHFRFHFIFFLLWLLAGMATLFWATNLLERWDTHESIQSGVLAVGHFYSKGFFSFSAWNWCCVHPRQPFITDCGWK